MGAKQLPEEIIEEILARLPVKSLLKFRCVSKSWSSLIRSKKFIKTHLEISTKNTNFTHHRIILTFDRPGSGFYLKYCSLHSLLNERVIDWFKNHIAMTNPINTVHLVGCCNGLVCILTDRRYFFLWNPATRMSTKLPDLHNNVKSGKIEQYGLGFDESSGDYKVFGIFYFHRQPGVWHSIEKVYSLKIDSWKIIKDRAVSPFEGAGMFVSGKLHWGKSFSLNYDWHIISFDLKSNMYGVVEQPSTYQEERGFNRSLGVLDGCLCVIRDYQKTRIDFWVLKEYGVKESWIKVVTVPYPRNSWYGISLPLHIGPAREILFVYDNRGEFKLGIYYPNDNQLRDPKTLNSKASYDETGVYVESLVSLVPDGEQEANSD